jgi:hypothetical protein
MIPAWKQGDWLGFGLSLAAVVVCLSNVVDPDHKAKPFEIAALAIFAALAVAYFVRWLGRRRRGERAPERWEWE